MNNWLRGGRPNWHLMEAALAGAPRKDGRVLAVMVMPDFEQRYTVLAVESSLQAGSLEGVFDDHAHKIIAQDLPDARKAKKAAEDYLRTWRRGGTVAEPCGCAEIGTTTATGKRAGQRPVVAAVPCICNSVPHHVTCPASAFPASGPPPSVVRGPVAFAFDGAAVEHALSGMRLGLEMLKAMGEGPSHTTRMADWAAAPGPKGMLPATSSKPAKSRRAGRAT